MDKGGCSGKQIEPVVHHLGICQVRHGTHAGVNCYNVFSPSVDGSRLSSCTLRELDALTPDFDGRLIDSTRCSHRPTRKGFAAFKSSCSTTSQKPYCFIHNHNEKNVIGRIKFPPVNNIDFYNCTSFPICLLFTSFPSLKPCILYTLAQCIDFIPLHIDLHAVSIYILLCPPPCPWQFSASSPYIEDSTP